ncbi:MAG: hypothetical protein ACYCQI_12530 [Gammaproteobacteria bacterium]
MVDLHHLRLYHPDSYLIMSPCDKLLTTYNVIISPADTFTTMCNSGVIMPGKPKKSQVKERSRHPLQSTNKSLELTA